MSKGPWKKSLKCQREGNCGYCRSCRLRINTETYRARQSEMTAPAGIAK